ncbi:MAG: hypothetical protein FD174_1961 [Geobacteraceae bacterium]|nr:MAG: hypothetical protein FD174_1961 [Geobacteraceae bacterium]
MTRILLMSLAILSLTGCSELQIIGRAAVKELQVEAINVEWTAYQQQEELATQQNKTIVAKAVVNPSSASEQKKVQQDKQQKGLWERR